MEVHLYVFPLSFNPTALRKAKIVYNFGLSECNRIKEDKFSYFLYFILLEQRICSPLWSKFFPFKDLFIHTKKTAKMKKEVSFSEIIPIGFKIECPFRQN